MNLTETTAELKDRIDKLTQRIINALEFLADRKQVYSIEMFELEQILEGEDE